MNDEQEYSALAEELADALNDRESLMYYEGLLERYTEEKLRDTLRRVLEIPERKIRKSRAAYFNYLMQQYGHQQKNYPSN